MKVGRVSAGKGEQNEQSLWYKKREMREEKNGKSMGKKLAGPVKRRKILSRNPSLLCHLHYFIEMKEWPEGKEFTSSDSYRTVSQDQYESIPGSGICWETNRYFFIIKHKVKRVPPLLLCYGE